MEKPKYGNTLPPDLLNVTSVGTKEARCWGVKAICNWVGSKTSKNEASEKRRRELGRNIPLRCLHCTNKKEAEPCGWKVQSGSVNCTQAYQSGYDFSRGSGSPTLSCLQWAVFLSGGNLWHRIVRHQFFLTCCVEKIGTFKGLYLSSFFLREIYYHGGRWPWDTQPGVIVYLFHSHVSGLSLLGVRLCKYRCMEVNESKLTHTYQPAGY